MSLLCRTTSVNFIKFHGIKIFDQKFLKVNPLGVFWVKSFCDLEFNETYIEYSYKLGHQLFEIKNPNFKFLLFKKNCEHVQNFRNLKSHFRSKRLKQKL